MSVPGRSTDAPDQREVEQIKDKILYHMDQAEAYTRKLMDCFKPCGDDQCTLARIGQGEYTKEIRG